jgi:hypothetical protein
MYACDLLWGAILQVLLLQQSVLLLLHVEADVAVASGGVVVHEEVQQVRYASSVVDVEVMV